MFSWYDSQKSQYAVNTCVDQNVIDLQLIRLSQILSSVPKYTDFILSDQMDQFYIFLKENTKFVFFHSEIL